LALNKKRHDIVDFHPDLLKIVDEKTFRTITDPNYYPLIKALKRQPMTLKELIKAYNKIAKKPRAEKTLYRYLRDLIEAELVVAAGQRVVLGKKVTETLYSRAARIYYWFPESVREISPEIQETKAKALSIMLESCGISPRSIECIKQLLIEMEMTKEEAMSKLAEISENEEFKELIRNLDLEHTTSIIDEFYIFWWILSQPELSTRFKVCFER